MAKKAYQKITKVLRRESAEDFEVFCEPCDRADIRLAAFGYCVDCKEHLCQSCFHTHRRPKPLQNHQLLDKGDMPLQQTLLKLSKSASGEQAGDLIKSCPKHTKELIKLFCHDHNALVCSVCVALEHVSTSCHVDYIPDISEQTLNSKELNEILKDVDKMQDSCIKITNDLKERMAKSTKSLKDALADIENSRKEMNKRLDELEKVVKDTAIAITNDNSKKLITTETTCDSINKSLKALADTLKDLNTNKKADQLFTELKIARQQLLDNEYMMLQLSTAREVDEYMYEPNQSVKTLLQNEKSLGTIRAQKLIQPAEPVNQAAEAMNLMSNAKYIKVKKPSDESDCRITGITVTPQKQIFVADFDNKSIKMIDMKHEEVIQQLQLEAKPCDITIITRDILAVTLPRSQTIQFLSYSSNFLTLKNKVTVEGQCSGISHHQGKLAVALPLESSLLIMDLKGNIHKKITEDFNGENIFSHPSYVSTDSQSIYVSDRDKSEIIWLNWHGEVIGRYGGAIKPSGVTLLQDGSFLVSNCKRRCITKVSGDCKDSKNVLENVESPWAMCWCPETSSLCVSRYNSNRTEVNNYIELYETK